MKLIPQSWSFDGSINGSAILRKLERAGRTCYKSESKITDDSAAVFCCALIKSGHHSVLEHVNVTVRIITNRGVSHELVRHRLASYSQESTRYCDYSGEMEFIQPDWCPLSICAEYGDNDYWPGDDEAVHDFVNFLSSCERAYGNLRSLGWPPQKAREVLPNALKTEIVMTCNIREWRHFFTLRCSKAAHPQMRALALDMLTGFSDLIPVIFDDIKEQYND